jgi:hypothetical protein
LRPAVVQPHPDAGAAAPLVGLPASSETAPELLPELEPELEPELLPELEPELEPELLPELEPELLPELEPELEPELLPELEPELLPELEPELLLVTGPPGGPESKTGNVPASSTGAPATVIVAVASSPFVSIARTVTFPPTVPPTWM